MTTTQQLTPALRSRIATAHEVLSKNGRLRAQTVGDLAGWRHIPTWELDTLVEMGLAVRLGATDGVCQLTYATVRHARAEGWS